jgi:hypothetical protein
VLNGLGSLRVLVMVFTQPQAPMEHVLQMMPQPPQLFTSPVTSMHLLPQNAWPG